MAESFFLILCGWLTEPKKLTRLEYAAIEDQKNDIYISAATIWEIAIKASLKKLTVPQTFKDEVNNLGFHIIPIDFEVAWKVKDLPTHHSDPFDRLIIATAQCHQLIVLTHDKIFKRYDLTLF